MTANNRNQTGQQHNRNNKQEDVGNPGNATQNTSDGQESNNEQIGRLESQPGNMSGVDIESQRTRSGNQDLASRGSDK